MWFVLIVVRRFLLVQLVRSGLLPHLQIPFKYRSGPWHPAAYATLVTLGFILFATADHALSVYTPSTAVDAHQSVNYLDLTFCVNPETLPLVKSVQTAAGVDIAPFLSWLNSLQLDLSLQHFRLGASVYMAIVMVLLARYGGALVFASYTVLAWNLLTLRCASAFVADAWTGAPTWVCILNCYWLPDLQLNHCIFKLTISISCLFLIHQVRTFADAIRFPALAGTSITVLVWWLVLVPVIQLSLKNGDQRKALWRFNSHFALVNVHLLNLPIAAIEFLATARPLTVFDMWVALTIGFLYMIFYLLVLDANGFHFYIVFTPRTVFCALTYSSIVALYSGIFSFWNYGVCADANTIA